MSYKSTRFRQGNCHRHFLIFFLAFLLLFFSRPSFILESQRNVHRSLFHVLYIYIYFSFYFLSICYPCLIIRCPFFKSKRFRNSDDVNVTLTIRIAYVCLYEFFSFHIREKRRRNEVSRNLFQIYFRESSCSRKFFATFGSRTLPYRTDLRFAKDRAL